MIIIPVKIIKQLYFKTSKQLFQYDKKVTSIFLYFIQNQNIKNVHLTLQIIKIINQIKTIDNYSTKNNKDDILKFI